MAKKDNRIKYNLVSGVVYQVVLIALSFLLPRLYLENFGSEVNGVLSTIKQIFVYMFWYIIFVCFPQRQDIL